MNKQYRQTLPSSKHFLNDMEQWSQAAARSDATCHSHPHKHSISYSMVDGIIGLVVPVDMWKACWLN